MMTMNNFLYSPRPRVLIIYTGGTIGMIRNPDTGALESFNFEHLRKHVPEIDCFDYVIRTYQFVPALDSSDMDPSHWAKIVSVIEYNYDLFDGFVILHGTDTMAYTASALSFMLENVAKPVVLTGSQLPIGMLRTDGRENLITAIEIAAAHDDHGRPLVPEVCVFFEQRLLRGNRTTKMNAENFNAFCSYNYPELAHVGIDINYNFPMIKRPDPSKPFKAHKEYYTGVLALTLFPGIRQELIEDVLEIKGIKGVILRTFGSGNAPQRLRFLDALRKAEKRGVVVVNVTQCQAGSVRMGRYETGLRLQDAGVVSGYDTTIEAAITKLMCLFGQGYSATQVRQLMNQSLAGEITV